MYLHLCHPREIRQTIMILFIFVVPLQVIISNYDIASCIYSDLTASKLFQYILVIKLLHFCSYNFLLNLLTLLFVLGH